MRALSLYSVSAWIALTSRKPASMRSARLSTRSTRRISVWARRPTRSVTVAIDASTRAWVLRMNSIVFSISMAFIVPQSPNSIHRTRGIAKSIGLLAMQRSEARLLFMAVAVNQLVNSFDQSVELVISTDEGFFQLSETRVHAFNRLNLGLGQAADKIRNGRDRGFELCEAFLVPFDKGLEFC